MDCTATVTRSRIKKVNLPEHFHTVGAVALAQSVANYPSKPMRMIIAYAPGGAVDVVGRIVAIELSKAWGQSVIPNNEAGGSGTVGLNQGMKATPDGYTLMM